MGRPSSIDKLPEEVRAEIGRLRQVGWTIDQIVEHLRGLLDPAGSEARGGSVKVPSRSAIGRHIQGLEKLGERMRRSRQVAEALVRELGDAPESTAARLNIELLHSAILDLFMKAGDGEAVDAFGQAALDGNPEGTMMLAKALDHLARASKTNVDFIAAAEARAATRAKQEAATAVDAVGTQKGLSRETIAAIKAGIFGVRAG
jgi:biotin operon repressor